MEQQDCQDYTFFSKEETFDKTRVSTLIVEKFHKAVQEIMGHALKGEAKSNYDFDFYWIPFITVFLREVLNGSLLADSGAAGRKIKEGTL